MTIWRIVLCVLAMTSVAGAEQFSLHWKFTPGDSENYRMTQTGQLDLQPSADNAIEVKVHRVIDLRWSIVSVEQDGTVWISLDVIRAQLQANGPGGQQTEFDSESKERARGYAASLSPMFQSLVESELRVRMNRWGEILELQIPEDLRIMLSGKPAGKALGRVGTEEDLLSILRLSMPALPAEEEFAVGDQWETSRTLDNVPFGWSTAKTVYQLQSVQVQAGDQIAVLVPKSAISLEGSEGREPEAKINDHECTGEILFNLTTGRLESLSIKDRLEIEVTRGDQTTLGTLVVNTNVERVSEF